MSEKKQKIYDDIIKLREQRLEAENKYYGSMIDYTKYQYLVSDVKWMTGIKDQLVERDTERKQK